MGKVTFEIPADDLERAKRFYSKVFGWSFEQLPFNYVLIDVDGKPVTPQDSDGGITPEK